MSLAVGCLWLATPFAQAAEKVTSLVQHNQVSSPYPASYTKQFLAKVARKSSTVVKRPTTKPAAQPVTKPSVMEIAAQSKTNPTVYQRLQRTESQADTPALVEAVVGSTTSANARTKLRIGYGKMIVDTSNTVGMKNGTRLEEPACLYVKTTLDF